MIFSIFTSPLSYSRTFSSPLKGNLLQKESSILISSPSFLSPAPGNCLFSVCMELPLLDIMYKWNHTVCSLLCLSPLSIIFSVFLHVVVHISTASNFLALVWISTVFSLPLLGSPTACSP